MKHHSFCFWVLLLVVAVTCSACHHKQHLELSKSNIVFGYAGGDDLFTITADCDWTIETDGTQNWMTANPTSGSNTGNVAVHARQNNSTRDRSTTLTVVSENGKVRRGITVIQSKIDINPVINKVWFLRFYERWDADYWNNVIPESYRNWIYYTDFQYENWYFYFQDEYSGYQIHTQAGDTIYYPCQYEYFPDGDSLNIAFETVDNEIEDYHAVVHELSNSNFSFSDEYDWHEFEKLNMVNVSTSKRNELKINKSKIKPKPAGPLIQLK